MANKVVLGLGAGILAGTKLFELYQDNQINKEQEEEKKILDDNRKILEDCDYNNVGIDNLKNIVISNKIFKLIEKNIENFYQEIYKKFKFRSFNNINLPLLFNGINNPIDIVFAVSFGLVYILLNIF